MSNLPGTPDLLFAAEHGIKAERVHPHVIYICERLNQLGYTAWLVGGAVRDLLLGIKPIDFDIACSASTRTLSSTFRNARVVGRRFPVVFVEFPDLCVQVSSFRGAPLKDKEGMIYKDNVMGSPYEDVKRRDFTINALFLELKEMTVIDYVGGVKDLHSKNLCSLQPPKLAFTEDPVRILRAVRFAQRLGMEINSEMRKAISQKRHLLTHSSRYRLNQELHRFCKRGLSTTHFKMFDDLGLLPFLLGMEEHRQLFDKVTTSAPFQRLKPLLQNIDNWHTQEEEELSQTVVLLAMLAQLTKKKWLQVMFYKKGVLASSRRILLKRTLVDFLGDWGFLKGQIKPSLQILKAAQQLMVDEFAPVPASIALPGTREAWLLLNLLAGSTLKFEQKQLKYGLTTLPDLPDLPILDHPRPIKRLHIGDGMPPSRKKRWRNYRYRDKKKS